MRMQGRDGRKRNEGEHDGGKETDLDGFTVKPEMERPLPWEGPKRQVGLEADSIHQEPFGLGAAGHRDPHDVNALADVLQIGFKIVVDRGPVAPDLLDQITRNVEQRHDMGARLVDVHARFVHGVEGDAGGVD